MSYQFWAIDYETANGFRGSPCALGAVRISNGIETAKRLWLIRPTAAALVARDCWRGIEAAPEEWNASPPCQASHVDALEGLESYFDGWNIELHGIGPGDVLDAPTFPDVLRELKEAVGDDPVVAHQASFDIGVTRDACDIELDDDEYGDTSTVWPDWTYACTLVLGRNTLTGLPSYSLPYCLEAARGRAGVPAKPFTHHDPMADARGAAELMTHYMAFKNADTLDDVLLEHGYRWGRVSSDREWNGCTKHKARASSVAGASSVAVAMPESDRDAYLEDFICGLTVVVTGKLPGATRKQAWEMIAAAGGIAQGNVTRDTDLLVAGEQFPHLLAPGAATSRKQKRAAALGVEVMSGIDFMSLLADSRSDWRA